jgi:HEPN domain-containing protein
LLPSHSHVSKQEWLDRSKSDWTRWGTQGKEFLKGAQQYFNDSNLSLAVFMLHQAVESSLIGIIKVLSAYRLSSHNLMRMFRITLLYTDEIMAVMDLDKKDANRLFNILQSGYSDARYKNDFNVNEKDVKSLLLQIELLVGRIDFVYMKFRTQLYRL